MHRSKEPPEPQTHLHRVPPSSKQNARFHSKVGTDIVGVTVLATGLAVQGLLVGFVVAGLVAGIKDGFSVVLAFRVGPTDGLFMKMIDGASEEGVPPLIFDFLLAFVSFLPLPCFTSMVISSCLSPFLRSLAEERGQSEHSTTISGNLSRNHYLEHSQMQSFCLYFR